MGKSIAKLRYDYKKQFGGSLIPFSWWGPPPYRFIDTGKPISKMQLYEMIENAGGEEEIYTVCLKEKITWLEYLGIRKNTEEEAKIEADIFKDWTF